LAVQRRRNTAGFFNRSAPALLYGAAVAGIVGLHLATNGTLGFHTDELYYLDSGRHPAFGYVGRNTHGSPPRSRF